MTRIEAAGCVTIQLDWKTAQLVAGACVVVAEMDDTDGNDAAALHLAWHEILKVIDEERS